MCIINDKAAVSTTRILVSPDETCTRQLVVYSNKVATSVPNNAMVLPVPGSAQDIQLYDLSHCPNFFDEVNDVFDVPMSYSMTNEVSNLPVLSCGSYKVTIVPDISSFDKIDRTVFDLNPTVESLLNKYYANGFSFLVCMLDMSSTKKEYHPIAYSHQMADYSLFVPTRHHHGFSTSEEVFSFYDHEIFGVNTQSPSPTKWLGRVPECFSRTDVWKDWKFPQEIVNMTKNTVSGELRNMDYNLPFHTVYRKESQQSCVIM